MLTGYPLSCTLCCSVLGIGSGVARFLMTAEYATYSYLRCVVNVMLLLSQLSFSFHAMLALFLQFYRCERVSRKKSTRFAFSLLLKQRTVSSFCSL